MEGELAQTVKSLVHALGPRSSSAAMDEDDFPTFLIVNPRLDKIYEFFLSREQYRGRSLSGIVQFALWAIRVASGAEVSLNLSIHCGRLSVGLLLDRLLGGLVNYPLQKLDDSSKSSRSHLINRSFWLGSLCIGSSDSFKVPVELIRLCCFHLFVALSINIVRSLCFGTVSSLLVNGLIPGIRQLRRWGKNQSRSLRGNILLLHLAATMHLVFKNCSVAEVTGQLMGCETARHMVRKMVSKMARNRKG